MFPVVYLQLVNRKGTLKLGTWHSNGLLDIDFRTTTSKSLITTDIMFTLKFQGFGRLPPPLQSTE